MVTQAFVDESYTDNATYVMGGYIASAEIWAEFSRDWEELLPLARLDTEGRRRFKMAEMAQPGRIGDVLPFYRVIERYDLFALSCKIDSAELERARERISVDGAVINWAWTENPYWMTFRCLMDMFHLHREEMNMAFPAGERIDFLFDVRSEQRAILAAWADYMEARPNEVREFYGARPRFENDLEFMPLQAADFWSWWVRKWYDEGTPERIRTHDFGLWQNTRSPKCAIIEFTEDQLAEFFVSYVRAKVPDGRPVYDAKYFPRSG